jgi:hypothetical protein
VIACVLKIGAGGAGRGGAAGRAGAAALAPATAMMATMMEVVNRILDGGIGGLVELACV